MLRGDRINDGLWHPSFFADPQLRPTRNLATAGYTLFLFGRWVPKCCRGRVFTGGGVSHSRKCNAMPPLFLAEVEGAQSSVYCQCVSRPNYLRFEVALVVSASTLWTRRMLMRLSTERRRAESNMHHRYRHSVPPPSPLLLLPPSPHSLPTFAPACDLRVPDILLLPPLTACLKPAD